MRSQRVVILSDTHIGKPGRGAPSAESLRPLWQKASRLILNGDVAEIHDPHLAYPGRSSNPVY